jgi:adenylosuccinate synthase
VVTKLDVLDELDEIPVCVGYKIKGKKVDSVPALATGFDQVECVYTKMPGWKKSTEGAAGFDQLPKKAQEYLRFLERESGAAIGMVSTGPDRDQTMMLPAFAADVLTAPQKPASLKSVKAK